MFGYDLFLFFSRALTLTETLTQTDTSFVKLVREQHTSDHDKRWIVCTRVPDLRLCYAYNIDAAIREVYKLDAELAGADQEQVG